MSKRTNTTSPYIGVCRARAKYFEGYIKFRGCVVFRCYSQNEIVCAVTRDLYIIDNLVDQHYKLNFNWEETDIFNWKNTIKEILEKDPKTLNITKYINSPMSIK